MVDSEPQIIKKIRDWLLHQGYPLEFRVAAAFQSAGITARQGFYVREKNTNSVRELDVVARIRSRSKGISVSVNILVECKWSGDKPWIVFTTPRTKMSPSACIAQTIGSHFGEAMMHCLAAQKRLHDFETFTSCDRNGFGGRRAFSNEGDQDHFYSAVQSIVSKSLASVADDDETLKSNKLPGEAAIAFPMIVIEGELFEAFLDAGKEELQINPADSIRLHWRGADAPEQWISTIDIVRYSHLTSFLATRKSEWETICTEMGKLVPKFVESCQRKSLQPLQIEAISRGYTGYPGLLLKIDDLAKNK
jgi:hypothetical protein